MNYFENQIVNIPFYYIENCDNCYFVEDGRIYNIDTKRFSKKKVKCSSVYYTINGKNVLEKDIIKIPVTNLSNNYESKNNNNNSCFDDFWLSI